MTCIVGLVHDGVAYIGGDSLCSNGHLKSLREDLKVFRLKNTHSSVLGFTTSYRMGQLLMYAEDLIDEECTINHEYMVTEFIPKVREVLSSGGFIGSGDYEGGQFIVANEVTIYEIDSDNQVSVHSNGLYSVGCGQEFALGSLHTTRDTNLTPKERIFKALEAAQEFSVGVQAPFYIMNTANNDIEWSGNIEKTTT